MEEQKRHFDLEERLIDFGVLVSGLVEKLPPSRAGSYIANQLIRSALSPALNYGEAQGAESRADFVHKLRIIIKELRETSISLKFIRRLALLREVDRLESIQKEANELLSIFVKSVKTVKRNSSQP